MTSCTQPTAGAAVLVPHLTRRIPNPLILMLILLTTLPSPLDARPQQPPTTTTALLSSRASTTPTLPAFTDLANPPPATGSKPLLQYSFLLLGCLVLILGLGIAYWSFSRRRKRRRALSSHPNPNPNVSLRDAHGVQRDLEEEGLDERGEPPPVYVKVPERVHCFGGGEDGGVELGERGRSGEGKPPDYEEGAWGRAG